MEQSRFAFSTSAYSRHSLQHALKHISDEGFGGVEILCDKPHAWMDALTAGYQGRVVKQLDKLGLFVSNINANCTQGFWSDAPAERFFEPSLVARSREFREWRIAYTKKALRFGKALNAKNVSVTSGKALAGVPPEKARKFLVEGLKRLAEHAEKMEQRFSVQFEAGLLIESSDEMAELIAEIDSNYFGANLNLGQLEISGQNPGAAIRKLKGKIFNVGLEDIRARKNYARLPGEGDVDFKTLFKALDDIGYEGPLTWDLAAYDEEPDDACKKTFKFVKSIGKK